MNYHLQLCPIEDLTYLVLRTECTTEYIEQSIVPPVDWIFDLGIPGLFVYFANMSKAKNLSATRQWRSVVHASVLCLEVCLNALEAKDTLTSNDLLTVERLIKQVEALDVELKDISMQ